MPGSNIPKNTQPRFIMVLSGGPAKDGPSLHRSSAMYVPLTTYVAGRTFHHKKPAGALVAHDYSAGALPQLYQPIVAIAQVAA